MNDNTKNLKEKQIFYFINYLLKLIHFLLYCTLLPESFKSNLSFHKVFRLFDLPPAPTGKRGRPSLKGRQILFSKPASNNPFI